MREWLSSVMAAAVLSALAELLAPEGKTRKYVTFAIAAVLLLVLLAPLAKSEELLSGALDALDFSETSQEQDSTEAALGAVIRASEAALADAARRELGLSEGMLSVSLSYTSEGGEVKITGLRAYVSASAPRESIRRYLTAQTGVECEVIVS